MDNIKGLRDKYTTIEGERFFKELFDKDEYAAVKGKKADIVFDIGACAGEFVAYIYPDAGKIYAFEASPKQFEELVGNIEEFNLSKVIPIPLALSGNNELQKFTVNENRGGNLLRDNGEEETIDAQCITLAQYMKLNNIPHIDILKIDIEGGEKAVFEAEDFKDVAGKITCIIGEHLSGQISLLEGYGFAAKHDNGNYLFTK